MGRNIAWGVMTFLSLAIVLMVSRYLTLDPNVFFPQQRAVYVAHTFAIVAHVAGGIVALGLGPFQFLRRLRARRPFVHRWIGRLYLTGVLVGGTAGLYMATFAYTGAVVSLGFATLAVLWLGTGALAFTSIRRRDIRAHRKWMTRNFALTFAAVTLRLQMPLLAMGFGEEMGYRIVAWSCWIPNLLVAEWLGRRARLNTGTRVATSEVMET